MISRLDYANGLLYNINSNLLHRLQIVQNTAARIILRATRHDRATPLLYSLHWLPIDKRILFKCLVRIQKCIHGHAPKYLSELMVMSCPTCDLRSGNQCLYIFSKTKTKFGDRAFVNFAPRIWNNLPLSLRSTTSIVMFKKSLKTYLFKS